MNSGDKQHVVRGEVFSEGRWVPIDKKIDIERQRRKRIEAGYVFYQGEWITINEKINRVVPSKPPEEKRSETIVINQYDNRIVYNIDSRTVHHHEHRHVHIGKEELEGCMPNRLTGEEAGAVVRPIESGMKRTGTLPERKHRGALSKRKDIEGIADGRKIRGLLEPPPGSRDASL